jgi:putative ABC transport system permease protein
MALFSMVFKKMLKNKWLVASLILGLIISVALITSIPMYTNGVLQKMLIKELEKYQLEKERFPGGYLVSMHLDDQPINDAVRDAMDKGEVPYENDKVQRLYQKWFDEFMEIDVYTKDTLPQRLGLSVLAKKFNYSTDVCAMVREGMGNSDDPDGRRYVRLQSLSDIEDHITLIDGKLPEKEKIDGAYEVLIPEIALNKLKIVLNKVFVVSDLSMKGMEPIRVKPVGVFTVKDESDPYWTFLTPQSFSESLLVPENLMERDFVKRSPVTLLQSARWYYAFDYHMLTLDNLSKVIGGHNKNVKNIRGIYKNAYIDAPTIKIIGTYFNKERQLRIMMWALNVPVIVMLFLYLFMVCKLIMDREKNEIALISSRGATRGQIVLGYLLQGLILGIIAFIIGPRVGLLLCKVLGASSGFLEFVQRKALPVTVGKKAYIYAGITIVISMFIIIIPAYFASKVSIVNYKRNISRRSNRMPWEKFGLDFILLGISGYGYYTFTQRQNVLYMTGISGSDISVDPLLFFIPALFILGAGLLCIRLYPFIIKFIYWLGKSIWPAHLYNTLIQVGRSSGNYHFLMVFLIMTLSIGLFSATAARTINKNIEERIMYDVGCDMALKPVWQSDAPISEGLSKPEGEDPDKSAMQKEDQDFKKVQFAEPPFLPYTQLSGVQHAAKVFIKDDAWIETNGQSGEGIRLMGIEPYDFGSTAWFREKLLKHHINEYLNLLADEPSACLISRSISKAYGIKAGDQINILWQGNNAAVFTVYAIVDYWPSWNPCKDGSKTDVTEPMLVVANLSYIQDHIALEPYEVWLKLDKGIKSSEVYDNIREKGLPILTLRDAGQQVIEARNNPSQLAINGSMTLGFIISGIICFLGFLLYWVLSLSARTLQFGILRGMGLSLKHLILMMVWEQLLTSGAAMVIGIFIGLGASRMFVPLFQMAYSAVSQVPPFRVISYASDRIRIYILMACTLGLGLIILGYLLSRIKIHQAIKLGED